jgi:thymidylate synthase (FAD)
METKRCTTLAAEEILGRYFPVLDHGFVSLVDYMGSDDEIARAARVSYGAGTRKASETRGLIRYLLKHRHCYAPEMEVLTVRGWLRWDECDSEEFFLVPDPTTRKLHIEKLALEVFGVDDEEMSCFKNDRMSYRVTSDHRMWFKKKFQGAGGVSNEFFEIVRAGEMSRWGHFDSTAGYQLFDREATRDPIYQFVGFYLGDGSYGSTNRISFHLKKQRKKDYLSVLIQELGLSCEVRPSNTYADASVFWIAIPDFLRTALGASLRARSCDKAFPLENVVNLNGDEVRGLWDGLVNSDGSYAEDRRQVRFSSSSRNLRALFETLSAMMGVSAHVVSCGNGGTVVNAYLESLPTLEARKQAFSSEHFTGKVYCTTTSTGLLLVRGNHDEFGFVCGNTSPLEMCELKFHCAMPIFVARQWVRHRTANLNEISGRYSVLPMLFYTPPEDQMRAQSKANKQGREGEIDTQDKKVAFSLWERQRKEVVSSYEWLNNHDFAREIARIDLPLSTYTQWYWKIDLHNLLHFLSLRVDSHAQWEIQQFGKVMAGMLKRVAPLAYEAWIDYEVCGARLSRMEVDALRTLLRVGTDTQPFLTQSRVGQRVAKSALQSNAGGMTDREIEEFFALFPENPSAVPDFELDLSKAKTAEFFEAEAVAAAIGK